MIIVKYELFYRNYLINHYKKHHRIFKGSFDYISLFQFIRRFSRFCTSLFQHKSFKYEQFKIEYCFVKENLIQAESFLNEIQLYRRPFAFIFFTVCHTSEQLRLVLDEYTKIKKREKGVYIHLFVQYRTINSQDQDEISNDGKLINGTNDES